MTQSDQPEEGRVSLAPVYYEPPATIGPAPADLVRNLGTDQEQRFRFYERIDVGRYKSGQVLAPGVLLVDDATVSSRHCSVTRNQDGSFVVRDVSRNGTRVDGRRLVPNLEFQLKVGQTIQVSDELELVLLAEEIPQIDQAFESNATVGTSKVSYVTTLVGDIRDYTMLVQKVPPEELQKCVERVFARLEQTVNDLGGTVKEYQGDAIFAFWEEDERAETNHAERACHAALALHEIALEIADDDSIWSIENFPLKIDWALATGPVMIDSFGGERRKGLSMVGEPVVLAFRIEKFVSDKTGPILACSDTREKAEKRFKFKRVGKRHAKGFEEASELFSLKAPRR